MIQPNSCSFQVIPACTENLTRPHSQAAQPTYMRQSLSGSRASSSSCCTCPSTLRASPSPE